MGTFLGYFNFLYKNRRLKKFCFELIFYESYVLAYLRATPNKLRTKYLSNFDIAISLFFYFFLLN